MKPWRSASGLALCIILTAAPSWAATTELAILLDITYSVSPELLDDAKQEIDRILNILDEGACVQILAISETTSDDPVVILGRECIPARDRLLDPRPAEVRDRILNEWRKRRPLLTPTRPATNVLEPMWHVAQRFSQYDNTRKVLLVFSDLRHNTGVGIDLDHVSEIDLQILATVKREGLLPDFRGVQVKVFGVHMRGKNPRYFRSLERFWRAYFEAAGASVAVFSTTVR